MKPSSTLFKTRVLPLLVIVVVIGSVATLAITAQTKTPTDTDGPGADPLTVNWSTLQSQPSYTVTRAFVGRVEAQQESSLGFELGGLVTKIAVNEGDVVQAGQVIARLDTRLLDARRAELAASRDQAQAQLDLADIRLNRIERAHARKAATDDELDEARQNRAAASADLARAAAALVTLQVEIDKSALRVPFDAVVASRHVDPGRVVSAGTTIVDLFQRDRPEVRLGVGGPLIESFSVGQTHAVEIGMETVTGTVRAILPSRSRTGRDVDVILELDATLNGIRRGDLARVDVQQTVDEPGVWLPVQSLTEGVRGLWSVYLLPTSESSGQAITLQRADVELMHPETDRVYVRTALPDGTRFVANGLHRLAPGMAVRLAGEPVPPLSESQTP